MPSIRVYFAYDNSIEAWPNFGLMQSPRESRHARQETVKLKKEVSGDSQIQEASIAYHGSREQESKSKRV